MSESFSFALLVLGGLSALTLCYVFLVAAGVAITRSRLARLDELVAKQILGARAAKRVQQRSEHFLLCSQFLLFFVTLILGFAIGTSFLSVSGIHVGADSSVILSPVSYQLGLLLAGFAIFVPFTLWAAQTAKAIAFHNPETTLCVLSLPLLICSWLLNPVAKFVAAAATKFLARLNLTSPPESECIVSAEEISDMVEASTEAGALRRDEGQMIQGVFSFAEMSAREIMTPRKDVVYMYENATLAELRAVFLEEGLSRLLIVGNDLDDVKGVLLVKDLLPFLGQPTIDFDLAKLCRKPLIVPGSKRLDDLLRDFRNGTLQLAVVVDELGGVEGLVTMEDLLEEIVGNMYDEYDSPSEDITVKRLKNGDVLVGGSTAIRELNEKFGFEFPLGDYDTFAGFVLEQLGHIPLAGESFVFKETRVLIAQVEQARLISLRLIKEKKVSDLSIVKPVIDSNVTAEPSSTVVNVDASKRVGISGIN